MRLLRRLLSDTYYRAKSYLPASQSPEMSWKASEKLMDTIRHYAQFPATGVSLRQMVQFGDKPSTGESPPAKRS